MRYILFIIFLLHWQQIHAQTTNLGSTTTIDVGGNVLFYIGGSSTFNGIVRNEGALVVENDSQLSGTFANSGTLEIKGDGAMDVGSQYGNALGATTIISGNASFNGPILNNGNFSVLGGLNTVVNGGIVNNNNLLFEGNLGINGTINNTGNLSTKGNMAVSGTLLNPDGATTLIEGNLNMGSAFTNAGIFEILGDALISDSWINDNESKFNGATVFESLITNNQRMFIGANTNFNGDLSNTGEITSFADAQLNFGNNKELGDLNFNDENETPITEVEIVSSADSIIINKLTLNINGKVTLPTNFVLVRNELNLDNGVLNTTNQENFLVQGTINVNEGNNTVPSYVEGKMLAVTSTTNPTVFPMGINGFPNFITLNSNTAGITVKVECQLPNPDSLLTDENTMGLAQEVEWVIESLGDSAEVQVSVDYSGVDFTQTPNFINAREYDATLQRFGKGDTVFHALRTTESINNNTDTSVPDNGTISTSNRIWVGTSATRFAIGLSPVLTEPEVYLPNIFTPGASLSENQIFRPYIGGAVISSVSFFIFDSFNKEVYSENLTGEDVDLDNIGWDGVLNSGLDAPEGVYYYNVSITYTISDDVSDKYFTDSERSQTQEYSKLGSVMLVK